MPFFDVFGRTPLKSWSFLGTLLTLGAAAALGFYTWILATNLQKRIEQQDTKSMVQLGIYLANGTLITDKVSGYGSF
jgi:hypothetical protein